MKPFRWMAAAAAVVLLGLQADGIAADDPMKPLDLGFPASAKAIQPALVGASVPQATLKEMDGTTVELKDVVAEAPSVVVFYRGGW